MIFAVYSLNRTLWFVNTKGYICSKIISTFKNSADIMSGARYVENKQIGNELTTNSLGRFISTESKNRFDLVFLVVKHGYLKNG